VRLQPGLDQPPRLRRDLVFQIEFGDAHMGDRTLKGNSSSGHTGLITVGSQAKGFFRIHDAFDAA
jgi:hypothetical protein